ncbi:MAG: prepilin-type N-terminal cleavage/methylation domain-containing protein [Nitrospirae bacterium]|nr:prepilin-type N-terminal cleavage/methylation domain-containing protein [Nitrospirota bacterium]
MLVLNKKGFTLIELMITLVISSIVVAAIYELYTSYYKSSVIQSQLTQLQQNTRNGIFDLERDIRMAGYGINTVNGQVTFVTAAPYEIIFNADIDSSGSLLAIKPGVSPGQVPANPAVASGVVAYNPGVDYSSGGTGAETVRWTLDSNDDGVIDNNDRMNTIDPNSTTNPNLYRLYRQPFGFNGANNGSSFTGAGKSIPIMTEGVRGPEPYPDGTRPIPLLQYWIREDKNQDGIIDSKVGERDVNGNGVIDEYLWGDDGSNGGTANNGKLEQGEITALLTGNGGRPKTLYMSNTSVTNNNGDIRAVATPTTLANELANISRVSVTLTAETLRVDENYSASAHGAAYKYHDMTVTSEIDPRNPVVQVVISPSLVLSASPQTLSCPFAGVFSTITATTQDDQGGPIAGIQINFAVTGGSFDNLSSVTTATGTTNSSGQASVSLYNIAGVGGSATVIGTGTIIGKSYSGLTTVYYSSGPANTVTVGAIPAALPSDGISKSTITATLLDSCGLPVADNTAVNFSIATSPSGIGGGLNPATGLTTGGKATTILTSGTSDGTATITATEPATTKSGFVNVPFTTCSLAVVPTYNAIMGDGASNTPVTATLKDLSNNLVSGIQIDLVTTEGTFNPSTQVKTISGTTNISGQVGVSLTSSPYPHTADITASVPSNAAQCANSVGTAQVQFTGCNVTVLASPSSVPLGGPTTVTTTFIDPSTGLPIASTPVSLSLDNPSLGSLSSSSGTTNASGQFTTTFTANNSTPGTVRITAVGACGEGELDLSIKSCNVVISANPKWILPNGTSTSAISATVTDSQTNNAIANENVTFSLTTTPGGIGGSLSPTSATTNSSGIATTTLTSGTSSGTATINAAAFCGTSSTTVDFNSWSITLSASPTNISSGGGGGGTSTLTATTYSSGVVTQPPVGSQVSFSFVSGNQGAAISPTPVTPSAGIAASTLTSGSGTGTVTVKAEITISGVSVNATQDITITSTGGLITYVSGSSGTCGGGHEKAGFIVENDHSDFATIQSMTISWDKAGAFLDKIKSEGNPPSKGCSGGTNVWEFDKCGGSGTRASSGSTISTTSCKVVKINKGATYTFNELTFKDTKGKDVDMRGVTFTITFNYTVGADTTVKTSTITFTTP